MSATASRHPMCRPHFAFARVFAIPAALLLAIAGGAAAAHAQGSRIGAPPAGAPPDQGAMPPPTSQVLADEVQETAAALRDAALKGTRAHSLLASLTTEVAMFAVSRRSRSGVGSGMMSIPTMAMIATARRTSVWPRMRAQPAPALRPPSLVAVTAAVWTAMAQFAPCGRRAGVLVRRA